MKRGFTLIEIIVVMAILAILSVMVMGSYKATMQKRNDLRRKSDLIQLGKALEVYYQDKGSYPLAGAGADAGKMQGCGAGGTGNCEWASTTTFSDTLSTVIYMAKMPSDPSSSKRYYYDSNGTYYRIYAQLENADDPDNHAVGKAGTVCNPTGTPSTCNYGVSSSNDTISYP